MNVFLFQLHNHVNVKMRRICAAMEQVVNRQRKVVNNSRNRISRRPKLRSRVGVIDRVPIGIARQIEVDACRAVGVIACD